MTRAGSIAYRLRWVILVVGSLCFAAGVWWIFIIPPLDGAGLVGTPAWLFGDSMDNRDNRMEVVANAALYLGVFLLTQWMFLRPGRGWRIKLTQYGRSMRSAVVAAGFAAMLLTVGMVLALLEIAEESAFMDKIGPIGCWIGMAVVWGGWIVAFAVYWRQGDRYTQLGKVVRGLVAGSFLELFVATGVYAWNPHNEDCYCARGSYTGLVFGGTALLWAFGPGVMLLFIREKHRQQKLLAQE
jgi:hypothetical protein